MGKDGIVRWVNLELAEEGLGALGKFPTDEELLTVARAHGPRVGPPGRDESG